MGVCCCLWEKASELLGLCALLLWGKSQRILVF